MAAAVAGISSSTAALTNEGDGYSNVPVTWDSTEDAIEHALHDDPDLLAEISSKLDTDLALVPDRNLHIEDDEDSNASGSGGGCKDSDTASNSSSLKDPDANSISSGTVDDISPRKGSMKSVITINKNSSISSQVAQVKEEASSTSKKSSSSSSSPRGNSSSPSPPSSSSVSKEKEYSNGKNGHVRSKDESRKSPGDESAQEKRRASVVSGTPSDTGSASSSSKTSSSSSSKNPLKLLRRLTKFEKNKKKSESYRCVKKY